MSQFQDDVREDLQDPELRLVYDETILAAKRALAEAFTDEYYACKRNRDWDPDGPDDETNPYYFLASMEERMNASLMVHFTASDGHSSMRVAVISEVVQVLAEAGLLRDAPSSTSTERTE